jgi:hypothetical protein
MRRWDILKLNNLKRNNEGVAGIIVAVMLIGILFAFLSMIQLNYVPDWTEERESEHMDIVATQFSQLKFSIDILSTVDVSGNEITTPITLGTQEIPLPFLKADKSFGYLKVLEKECSLNITDKTPVTNSYELGSIRYASRNSQYVNAEFVYEVGGVIINQESGNTMYVLPYFDVDYSTSVDIDFKVVNFIETTGNKYTTGHGNVPLKLEYIQTDTNSINNINLITIYSEYQLAWSNFLNDTLSDAGLNYGASNDFVIIQDDDEITVDFNDALSVDITLKVINIDIKIGPGWLGL